MNYCVALLLLLTVLLNTGCASPGQPSGESYGAVAYASSTQDWRLRWRVADPRRARQKVLEDCARADCRIVLEFGPGQCGTLALGKTGMGVGLGTTAAAAETAALANCREDGRDCQVAEAECN